MSEEWPVVVPRRQGEIQEIRPGPEIKPLGVEGLNDTETEATTDPPPEANPAPGPERRNPERRKKRTAP